MEKKKIIKELARAIHALELEIEFNRDAKFIAEYLFKQLDILKWTQQHQYKADITAMEMCSAPSEISLPLETTIVDDVNDFVDRMYDLYPSKCPKRNTSTGKSRKDKDRIRRLLRTYTREQIEQVIRAEVDNNYGVNYMKNFSTFLNNFPEPPTEAPKVETKVNELIINGVRYQ